MKKELEKETSYQEFWARRPEDGGASACWRGSADWGGLPERCPAGRTTRSVPWSLCARRASGVATGDDSDGEVWRDARNELQWVEVNAPGNSLAVKTHRGGTAPVRAARWGLTVAEVL
jgi:hypothetical protein